MNITVFFFTEYYGILVECYEITILQYHEKLWNCGEEKRQKNSKLP